MGSLMLESVFAEADGKPLPILLDLGYWSEETARRFQAVLATGISRRNSQFQGYTGAGMKLAKDYLAHPPLLNGG